MEVVLDSNEFIFGFTGNKKSCSDILKLIGVKFNVIIPDIIFREVFERLKIIEGKDFASAVRYAFTRMEIKIIDEKLVPEKLGKKYFNKLNKKADSAIAAFTEWVNCKYLVSENRHFLEKLSPKPFKVLNAEDFIKKLKLGN